MEEVVVVRLRGGGEQRDKARVERDARNKASEGKPGDGKGEPKTEAEKEEAALNGLCA